MMWPFPILHLLAKDDADSNIKSVFFVIIAVIWIIGALMSALKKKADRQRWNNPQPQQDWSNLLRDLTAGQNKPFNPSMPAPPPVLPPQTPRPQPGQRPQPAQRQQIKSFAQQSPRPFVQQYRPQQIPRRPAQVARKTIQPPRPIQKRPKPQRRPPAIPPQTLSVPRPPEAQVGLIQDATITLGPTGGATAVQHSPARTSTSPLTRGQLRKLILWSEVLGPPLSLREN